MGTRDFIRILDARYGGSHELATCRSHWNARAVTVEGTPCVAKLIPRIPGDAKWNKRQDARFAMERRVYARLPKSWPIKLVEAFRTAIGSCIVTTAYAETGWASYRPSDASDRAVARSLMAQLETIHRMGVAHGDILLKNVLFSKPADVVIIDFEKSVRCSPGGRRQIEDYEYLVGSLCESANTRGVAFYVVEHLLRNGKRGTAKEVFVTSVGYIADDARKWRDAEAARLEREEAEREALAQRVA
jgi:serine/threonine protein kinase